MTSEEVSKQLADALLSIYRPGLRKVEKQLSELTSKQNAILKDVQAENQKFSNMRDSELNSMFLLVRKYQILLLNMKREMVVLTERSAKLKKRALKLEDYKKRESLENAHYRESQMKREQDLVAKPYLRSNNTVDWL